MLGLPPRPRAQAPRLRSGSSVPVAGRPGFHVVIIGDLPVARGMVPALG